MQIWENQFFPYYRLPVARDDFFFNVRSEKNPMYIMHIVVNLTFQVRNTSNNEGGKSRFVDLWVILILHSPRDIDTIFGINMGCGFLCHVINEISSMNCFYFFLVQRDIAYWNALSHCRYMQIIIIWKKTWCSSYLISIVSFNGVFLKLL